MPDARYRIELTDYYGTDVTIDTHDKVIGARLELACTHIFKEFAEKRNKNEDGLNKEL